MTPEDRALTIAQQMRKDMITTLRAHLGPHSYINGQMLTELVSDGMFHVEHLLVALEQEQRHG